MQTPGTTASGMQTASSPQITAMPSSATTEGAQMAQSGQQRGKILIVLSSADHITLQGGKEVPTGFFMNELCTPLEKLLNNGWKVEFADPKGEPPASISRSRD